MGECPLVGEICLRGGPSGTKMQAISFQWRRP
jgi:hypothetical protein